MRRLYHAVDRLVRSGLVEAANVERAGNWPERSIYRITAEGREDLAAWITDLIVTIDPDCSLFAAALSFLGHLPVSDAVLALEERTAALEGAIAGLDAQTAVLRSRLPRIVLVEEEHGRAMHAVELSGIRTFLEDLRTGAIEWDAAAIVRDE